MRLPWRRLTSVLALAAAIAAVPTQRAASAETTAEELVQALQRRYDSIKDFSADFVHRYQGGVLRKQISERGHVLIKTGEDAVGLRSLRKSCSCPTACGFSFIPRTSG